MAQKKYTDGSGVSEIWLNIKNWVTSQLLGYSQTGHTHTKSQITDLDLSNYVDKTSNQTVGGNKDFTGYIGFGAYSVRIKNSSQEIGVVPSSNKWNGIVFTDKNNRNTFSIEQAFMANGNTMIHFSMTPNIANGSLLQIFESTYNASTGKIQTKSRTLIPDANNSRDLGSSRAQWNNAYIKSLTINGVACGDILTHNASEFALVSDLSTVATSGSYNDLTDKPTIPSPYSPPTFTYDSSTETLTVSNTTATVITYDAQTEKLEIQING